MSGNPDVRNSNISSLNNDILLEIIHAVVKIDPIISSPRSPWITTTFKLPTCPKYQLLGWIKLAHVCQRWRALLLCKRHLWADIICDIPSPSAFDEFLARAGKALLSFALVEGIGYPSHHNRQYTLQEEFTRREDLAFKLLAEDRVKSFHRFRITRPEGGHDWSEIPNRPLLNLQSLNVEQVNARRPRTTPPGPGIVISINAPNLLHATFIKIFPETLRNSRLLRTLKRLHDKP